MPDSLLGADLADPLSRPWQARLRRASWLVVASRILRSRDKRKNHCYSLTYGAWPATAPEPQPQATLATVSGQMGFGILA